MPEQTKGLYAELRRQKTVSMVRDRQAVSVDELSNYFSVSAATIRSDLSILEKDGLLKRTHGGAISMSQTMGEELTSEEKAGQNLAQKQAIARAALGYIKPGDVIALDTGTTTLELARLIVNIPNLTVITNDLHIAALLEAESDCSVVLLGGMIRHRFHCTIGNSLKSALQELYIDTLFLGTNGISARRGFSTPSLDIAEAKKAMIASSGRRIVLADSSKTQKEGFVTFSNLEDIGILITDTGIESEFLEAAEAAGMEVVRADPVS